LYTYLDGEASMVSRKPRMRWAPVLVALGAAGGACVIDPGDSSGRRPRPDAQWRPSGSDGAPDGGPPADAAPDAPWDGSLPTDCPLGPADESTELRCTGLYADWERKTLGPGVRAYDPGLHLWSDGAEKTRWIYLPLGTQIDTSDMDEWTFPYGTKLWKEFVVGGNRIETRMLWKRPASAIGGWYLTTYRWSADGSRADELTTGEANADGHGYQVPAQSLCVQCHAGRRDMVMGFEAVSLASPGAGGLAMPALLTQKLLTAPPTSALTIPGDAATTAALGYLHANCGTACHNRGGGAASSIGFFMRLDVTTLGSVQTTDAWRTGMNVAAYFAVPAVEQAKIFAPCSPQASAAYYRMSVRDGVNTPYIGSQMPPIASHLSDPNGLAIVAAWLNGQPGCQAP
jgi:hypothetical protein